MKSLHSNKNLTHALGKTTELFQSGLMIALLFLIVTPDGIAAGGSDEREVAADTAKVIRSIRYDGKFKLRASILNREIDSRPGRPYDAKQLDRDRKKIDGLGIFSEVRTEVREQGDSVDVVFHLTEVWTLTPITSISMTDNSLDWLIGFQERDLVGTLCNVRSYYRRFEHENSYLLEIGLPRTLGRDVALGVLAAQERERDIVNVDEVETTYRYLSKYLAANLGLRVSEVVYPSLYVGYTRENWHLIAPESPPERARRELDYPRYLIGSALALGMIYSDHYYFDGLQLVTNAMIIRELPGNRFDHWRLQFVGRGFVVASKINFCARAQYATSSRDERVSPYAISGNYNVRGFRDKYDRGDQLLGFNFEARRKVIETKRWYSQAALFVDAAALWGRNHSASAALKDPYWSFGGGMRLAYKKWPRLGRADVIYNTTSKSWTYYFSSAQFF